jgi:hypothetical protein
MGLFSVWRKFRRNALPDQKSDFLYPASPAVSGWPPKKQDGEPRCALMVARDPQESFGYPVRNIASSRAEKQIQQNSDNFFTTT